LGSFQYNYLKVLNYFETRVQEGRDLTFRHHLLPPPSQRSGNGETTLGALNAGNNPNSAITLTIVRVMHHPKSTYLLATAARPFTL
jgi:hypothetical protein